VLSRSLFDVATDGFGSKISEGDMEEDLRARVGEGEEEEKEEEQEQVPSVTIKADEVCETAVLGRWGSYGSGLRGAETDFAVAHRLTCCCDGR
jgi:hypothetical protein